MRRDLAPLAAALLPLANAQGVEESRARAESLQHNLRTIEAAVLDGNAATAALEVSLATEFLRGLASLGEEAHGANGFNPMQARDTSGRWTDGGGGGGTGKPKPSKPRASVQELVPLALDDPDNRDWVDYASLSEEDARLINERTGEERDLSGYKRSMAASEVQHAFRKHSKDHRPITREDFSRVPALLASPLAQRWERQQGKRDRLISFVQDNGTLKIIEEQRTGRKSLAFLNMYRP